MAHDLVAHLALGDDDALDAHQAQLLAVAVGLGPRHDTDAWVPPPRVRHRLPRGQRVRHAYDERVRLADVDLVEHRRRADRSVDHGTSGLTRVARQGVVAVDGDPGEAARFEDACHGVADTAVAQDHRVAPERRGGLRQRRHRAAVRETPVQAIGQAPCDSEDRTGQQHAQDDRAHRLAEGVGADGADPQARGGEDEAELTGLRDHAAGAQRNGRTIATEPGHPGHERALRDDDEEQEQEHDDPAVEHFPGLDQDPCRDEEDRAEQLTQRHDLAEHARREVRLGEGKAGDEGAEGDRDAEVARPEGGADRDAADRHHEELARAEARDAAQQRRQDARPDGHDRHDEEECHGGRQDDAAQDVGRLGGDLGQDHDEDHGQQVLHDRPADRDLALGRVAQRRLAHHLCENHRRTDRDRRADEGCLER